MIKRYYQSLNSLYIGTGMTFIAFLVFAFAFIRTEKNPSWALPAMAVSTAALAVCMFFYYRNKLRIAGVFRSIKHPEEYEKGGVVDRTWILEDRMIACLGLQIKERKTTGITKLVLEEKNHGNCLLHITDTEDTYTISAKGIDESSRFAAFLLRKNPDMVLENVVPRGDGSLKELGAVIEVKNI